MGPPSKEPVEAVVDPRAAPRQSLLEVTYAKLDAKGVGARGVNDLPSRVVLLCENDSRLESAETSGSFWPAVFAGDGPAFIPDYPGSSGDRRIGELLGRRCSLAPLQARRLWLCGLYRHWSVG